MLRAGPGARLQTTAIGSRTMMGFRATLAGPSCAGAATPLIRSAAVQLLAAVFAPAILHTVAVMHAARAGSELGIDPSKLRQLLGRQRAAQSLDRVEQGLRLLRPGNHLPCQKLGHQRRRGAGRRRDAGLAGCSGLRRRPGRVGGAGGSARASTAEV